MARKYDLISAVYERTAKTVSDSPINWQNFLRSACRNFKLRFDEQLLIFAQRPDATAVLEIEKWNETFGRWVNKGARGIAVFEDADRERQRLKHYFDISDTHESRRSRPVPIWHMKPEYESEVIEALENTFGDLKDKRTLEEAIVCAAENAVEDNLDSYTEDLIASKEGSLLEELDDLSIQVRLRQLVTDSVAFMVMARLGLKPMDYFGSEDFTELGEFNTVDTIHAVGFATSDIAEMALTEIARTIHALDRQNRILADQDAPKYNEPENKAERSSDHERDPIHDAGRLSAPESDIAGAAGGDPGTVRPDAAEVPAGAPSGAILQSADEGATHGASQRGGTESELDGGNAGSSNGYDRGRQRESEGDGHDGVGPQDEQSEERSAGDRDGGGDLRLSAPLPSVDEQISLIEQRAEEKSPALSVPQEVIDATLQAGSGFSEGKMRIYEQFQKSLSAKENAEFLKKEYGIGGSSHAGGFAEYNQFHDGKGLKIAKGYVDDDRPHIRLTWTQVEKRIAELIRLDRYLNSKEQAAYPDWLAKQEEQRREAAGHRENRAILSAAPPEKEAEPEVPAHYEYHLGDTVYLGAQEFEILSFDDRRVMLHDVEYPLFQREETREDFDRMVTENPMNDHLRVKDEVLIEPENSDLSSLKVITLYCVGNFYEMYGRAAQAAAQALNLTLAYRQFDGERVPMCGIPAHSLTEYADKLETAGFTVPVNDDPNAYKHIFDAETRSLEVAKALIEDFVRAEYDDDTAMTFDDLGKVGIAYTTITDDEIPIQVNVDLKHYALTRLVADRVFEQRQYETMDDLIHQELSSLDFSDLTYVDEDELAEFLEPDDFSDIDPVAVRKALAESGIVNGQVVDPEKLSSAPFIRQVMADVEEAAEQTEPPKPAWEQKKRSRVQTFDLHPDIPMADRLTFDLASHEVEEVGKKERFYHNLFAIQVLQKCRDQNRFATSDEQIVLSKYVGWGGLPEAFDENNSAWEMQYQELKTALAPEEYASARESTLTAFYTPPVVIQAIYKAMERMGFKDGNILEPSCGIGNFIGMLPPSMREAKVYGVEMDKVSAGIAQQLYQRSSIAAQPFEETSIPDSFFDMVAGNIPFGDFSVADKRYDKHHFLIHDYFLAKSLDKLRPGGVMALVTSKGTLDKENCAVRKYLAQRADLLGAIRLPNNTFKGNAGTEVVSDILILQKRDRLILGSPSNYKFDGERRSDKMSELSASAGSEGYEVRDANEPDWVHLDTDENGFRMNSYFVQHPEMVLGEVKMVSGRFGEEMTVVPYEGADLESQLDEAIANIHGEITEYQLDEEFAEEDNSIPADPSVRNFSYTVLDDKIYYRENSRMAPVEVSATAENRIKGMIQIRDCVRLLLEMQTEDFPDETIREAQQQLNQLYDSFAKKYGLINSRANVSAFSQDSSFSLLSALEVLDEDGELKRKADIFTKRTIKPHVAVTCVETASEALTVSMAEKARIDMGYMSSLSGKTEKELYEQLKGVIFLNPKHSDLKGEAKYLMADEYLSGNVREKLAFARKSNEVFIGDYDVNIEALEKVQPKDLTASEIFVRLGTTWVPPEIVQQFIYEFLGTPRYAQWNIKVHYSNFTSEWNIEGKSYDRGNIKAYSTYGTQRINAYKIIEETLNLKDVRIFDYVEDETGKKKPVLNAKETAIAQAKQEQIKQGFQDWVWADPGRRELLCNIYNEKFNSTRPREYDGSHITFAGMNPEIELRKHQKNAVAHILYGGNTLLAHAVGAGKTYEMAAAAMESKRLGLCNKPLFVVPNHLTEQWAAEFLQLYPAANILVATKKDFETKNRKRFCGRIATGDYDAVIIGHSQFEKIPMSVERQVAILEQERDEIMEGIAELKANRGEKFSIKQLEKSKKAVETKLKKLNDQSRKDDVVTFEELGVDRIFIDESHYYKNLYLYTKMRNVGGIAQTEAQKSSDLFMKCRYLDELTGGRGTVFATGTPISNSMVELYTIQRYLQYNTLVKHGLQHFDAWASAFGETVTAAELRPEGYTFSRR